MRTRMFVFCLYAALFASSASAHGPQIQLTVDAGKITTRQMLPGNSYSTTNGLTAPASIYVLPVNSVSFLGNPVARVQPKSTETFGPGFTYGYDQLANPGGTRLFAGSLDLKVGGLTIWNGLRFVDTGAGLEQLGLLQSSSNVIADTVKTVMGSDSHITIPVATSYGADEHSSMRYQLLGDGLSPNVASRDGVYLATLGLSGTQASPTLAPSDTFYFILAKNVPYDTLRSAVSSFAASQRIGSSLIQFAPALVPEPATLATLVTGLLGMLGLPARRRRCQATNKERQP